MYVNASVSMVPRGFLPASRGTRSSPPLLVSSPAGSPTCELQAPARCCTHPNNQPRAPVTLVLPLGRQAPRGARAAAEGTRPGAGPLGLSSHHSSAEARECKTGSL